MNSSRPNPVEQTQQRNWLEIAKRKFAGATIVGQGQFAVRVFDHVHVYLYERFEDAAEHTSRDPEIQFTDLAAEPVQKVNIGFSNIKSAVDWDDRLQERREARQRQQAEQQRA